MLYHLIGSVPRVYSVRRKDGTRGRKQYDFPVIGAVQAACEREAVARFIESHGPRPETVRVQYDDRRQQAFEAFGI